MLARCRTASDRCFALFRPFYRKSMSELVMQAMKSLLPSSILMQENLALLRAKLEPEAEQFVEFLDTLKQEVLNEFSRQQVLQEVPLLNGDDIDFQEGLDRIPPTPVMADTVHMIYPDPAAQPEDTASDDEAESALGAEPSADWSLDLPTINDDGDTEQ
jgi:hypothetical protein